MNKQRNKAFEMIDDAASILANTNDVEMAWYLRGIIDGLNNQKPDPPTEYKNEYMHGFNGALKFNNE